MDYFVYYKKYYDMFIFTIIIALFLICPISYAGNLIEIDGFTMYKTNSGVYAKDCWVWLDINGDSIKECYRFDEDGHIAKNYVGHDNRRTNELGQLIENGFVMKKLASGIVLKGDGKPEVAVEDVDGNVGTISNIIYANGGNGAISTITSDGNIKSNNQIVAGKNIKNYITAKNNAKTDVEKVIIFGNDIWEDVIELRGNNSSIKVNTKNFNYMSFEVAEENHIVDKENDELVSLDIYVDGELYESLDEFNGSEPQIEELEELDGRVLELKVRIDEKNKYRKVYIRNGRLKKIREKDE